MEVELISFGKIAQFIASQKIEITGIDNTDNLKVFLEESFPGLKSMRYKLALNNELVQRCSYLANNDTVAIMPPFSGG